MNTTEQDLEIADRFLANKMNEQEYLNVKKRIESDKDFRALIESQIELMTLIKHAGRNELRVLIRSFEDQTHTKSGQLKKIHYYLVAAVLFISVGFALWYFSAMNYSSGSLYADYMEPYRAPVNIRSGQTENNWEDVSLLYESGNFEQTEDLLNDAERFDQESDLVQFYKAMSIILNSSASDDNKAIILFSDVAHGESDYVQQAEWYLAMGYLKVNDVNNAREVLHRIVKNSKHHYFENSKSLLKRINKLSSPDD